MKKKFLSMLMLVCLLITAMPTAFAAADGDVTKTFTAIFHSAMDETKVALEGVESRIELTDGNVAVQKLTEYNTEGTSTCEITYNGDMFVYEYEELEDGKEEPTHYRYEYPYLRVVTNRMPDDYDPSIIDELYTVEEFIEMVGEGDGATVYYPVDTFKEELWAADGDEYTYYEIYRKYYNEEYANTSVYFGCLGNIDSAKLVEALNCLEKATDTCVNVYVQFEEYGEGFPAISAEAMTILNEYDAFVSVCNNETYDEVYWWPTSSNTPFEFAVAENASVTEGLDAAKIPYVLLSVKGMEGATETGFNYAIDGGILADGEYSEDNGDYSDLKCLYYYDATNKIFKLCSEEVEYYCCKDGETQEYYYSNIYYEGTFPVSGYYVIVDGTLPDALTTETDDGKVDVKWSTDAAWTIEIENVVKADDNYRYNIYIKANDEVVESYGVYPSEGYDVILNLSDVVATNGPADYVVELTVRDMESGEIVYEAASDVRTYKPETRLATPANLTIDFEAGKITFDQVDGAEAYNLYYCFKYVDNAEVKEYETTIYDDNLSDGKVVYEDKMLPEVLKLYKENFTDMDIVVNLAVCAISADIQKAAYSEFAKVLFFENKLSKEQVKENFDKAFENVEEEPYEAAEVLDKVSNDTLVEMIKTDAEFAQKVEKLDNVLIEELGDGYKGATSETNVVDVSKVKVVGAAINGRFADTVELTFAEPEEEATVPEGYKNGVQLDISLLIDGRAQENLSVPITITMPIPAGVDTKDLVILHYHGGATEPVVIVPTVNADGTMTFIVDGFSTFVVANQVVEVTAPKTGDSSATVAICSLLLLAAGVVLMKRNAFAK